MEPAARRQNVQRAQGELRLSQRRLCRALGWSRSSLRYRARRPTDARLRGLLHELAEQRPRFGYRRLWVLLRRQGERVNKKRVYRLYREEKLQLRLKKRRRRVPGPRGMLRPCSRPNHNTV